MKTPPSPCPIDIIRRAQEALFSVLPPNSPVTHEKCISELLGILDSPECRLATARHAHAVALRDFQRLTAKLFIEHAQDQQAKRAATAAEAPAPLSVAQSPIEHLRAELERVRKHETHLIQHRDELIQKLSAAEKRLEAAAAALR
jgi:hypothetical protein